MSKTLYSPQFFGHPGRNDDPPGVTDENLLDIDEFVHDLGAESGILCIRDGKAAIYDPAVRFDACPPQVVLHAHCGIVDFENLGWVCIAVLYRGLVVDLFHYSYDSYRF